MPKLNKLLVTSIIADIRECVYVANEIYSWVGGIEHLSWKFPTKIARDINAMEIVKEHDGTAGEFYILLLELAYDRIQFTLRLIVEFMDKYPFVDDFFKEVTCISRPNHISLASLLRLIWDRLKTIPDSISRHMANQVRDRNNEGPKVSRSSQAGASMSYCESCGIAGKAVLQVINTIEHVFLENKLISVAAERRNECRNDIYELTQWAVMSRLSEGIGMDIEMALNRMKNSDLKIKAVKQNHEKSMKELQSNLMIQQKRADILQAKNMELQDTLENVKQELKSAKHSNTTLKLENETLTGTLADTRRQILGLASGNSVLQSQVATLAENKLELEKTVIRLGKEVVDNRDAYLEAERLSQTLLNESRKENDSMRDEYAKEIERLQQEIASLRSRIAAKEDNEEIDRNNSSNSSKEPHSETILMPEDDPVVDMTRQLISNQEKIEVLSRQNERLSKTLHRLRKYRLTGRITSYPNK